MGFFQWLKRLFGWAPRTQVPYRASPFPPGTGPARIVVLRHAEKTGDKRDPLLSAAGVRRADMLVEYIPAMFGRPDFLIAAKTSKRSRRPVQTLEPIAAALALPVRAKIDDDDSDDLVEMLRDKPRYQGKFGVVCWRHSELPELLAMLGAAPGTYPVSWDENDYTTIVDIVFPGTGEVRATRMRMPD